MDKYDNLCIAIKLLVQQLVKPPETRNILLCYHAICVADDPEMKSKLEWLAGIEVHSTGAYGRSNCLVWSDDVQRFQSSGDHGELMDEVYETVHHDDVDACEEAAFELWLEKVGVLIE